MRYVTSIILFALLAIVAHAQQPAPTVEPAEEVGSGDVLKINANLVNVPVTVINRQGRYVVDLKQTDFRVFEDGVEQTIAHFSNVDQPLKIVLLLDTSGSTEPFLNQIKSAAKAFVRELRPADAVKPIYFHGEIKPLAVVRSNDPVALNVSIDQMKGGPWQLGTRLYDAVDFGLQDLKRQSGRKVIILFTDGENTWGKATMKSTLRDAEESDVVVYTLQYGDGAPDKYLQELASRTGGNYFKGAAGAALRTTFISVADELRRQYTLGYYPKLPAEDSRERKIKVKVNRKRVAVRARAAYTSYK
jgi:Ca-activated chloride channel homolog